MNTARFKPCLHDWRSIIFIIYNLESFGVELNKIRKKCRITQNAIYLATGINPDTIRKLEKGATIPKYETLEILSHLYKVDLLNVLKRFRHDQSLTNLYLAIDQSIISNNIESLITLEDKLKSKDLIQRNLINGIDYDLFSAFIRNIIIYYSEVNCNIQNNKSVSELIEYLKLSIQNYKYEEYGAYQYKPLEIRLLLLIGLFKVKMEELLDSNNIFLFCLDYLIQDNEESIWHNKLILKCYFNLSYNHHRLDLHEKALDFAIKGIEYAKSKDTLYSLAHLYARKGISELFLDKENHLTSLKRSLDIFDALDDEHSSKLYRNILKKQYQIIL